MSDVLEDGLLFGKRQKIQSNARAKKSIMPFTDQGGNSTGLKELLDDVLSWRNAHLNRKSDWLFCTSQGEPYIKENGKTSGFNSQWQRAMKRALDETELTERFTEHDLCAKTASDVESLDQAASMRGHLNKSTTEKVYRRKPNVVMPLKNSD